MRTTRYTVYVDRTSAEVGKVGAFVSNLFTSHHRTMKAAQRRLGSLINGNRSHLTKGMCRVYAHDCKTGRDLSWVDLRNLIEDGTD